MSGPGGLWSRWRVRAGYVTAVGYFLLAAPTQRSIFLGAVVAAVGLVLRGVAAGHLRKQQELATSGPYARARHPLYFGSAFLALGFCFAGHSWRAAVLVAAYFVVFYFAAIRSEEAELRAGYGRAYEEYAARVPVFWPRWKAPTPAGLNRTFSWAQYRRNREYDALLGYAVALALLWLRMRWRG